MIRGVRMKYPVIHISDGFLSAPEKNIVDISIVGDFVLEETYRIPNRFIDSSGRLWPVLSYTTVPLRDLPYSHRLRLILSRLLHPEMIWLKHQLGEPSKMTLGQAKSLLVSEALRLNKRWKADGPSITEFKARIDKAKSFEELCATPICNG